MRIVVADDEILTREGIAHLLSEAGHEVVGRAENAHSLLHHVRAARPDAVIVDIRMPPTYTDEGLAAAGVIRAEHPGIGVLVLSQFIEPSYALRLVEDRPEGAGYLLKERIFEVANLTDALDRIQAGETVIDPAIVTRLVGRRRSRTHSKPSLPANWKCSDSSRKVCRTGRSRRVCSSLSAPSRRT